MVQVKVFNNSSNELPEYKREGDAAKDVRSAIDTHIAPGHTVAVPTGLYVKIPGGYKFNVLPRSGLSLNTTMRIANAPGTIDSNFLGELCIIVDNIGTDFIQIRKGDRIAQISLEVVIEWGWDPVEDKALLGETNRGENGFGSSGIN